MARTADKPPSAARAIAWAAAIVAIPLVVASGWLMVRWHDDAEIATSSTEARLAVLRANAPPELPTSTGAVLLAKHEFQGTEVSDGPALWWEYSYEGDADSFMAIAQQVLTQAGWTLAANGNLPGQVGNLSKSVDGHVFTVSVFAPSSTRDNFELHLSE